MTSWITVFYEIVYMKRDISKVFHGTNSICRLNLSRSQCCFQTAMSQVLLQLCSKELNRTLTKNYQGTFCSPPKIHENCVGYKITTSPELHYTILSRKSKSSIIRNNDKTRKVSISNKNNLILLPVRVTKSDIYSSCITPQS